MRPLRPAALPSGTSVRFVLLLASVTTSSLYMFQALWFAGRGQEFADAIRSCGLGVGQAVTLDGAGADLGSAESCRSGMSREQALVAVGGTLLVLVAAWIAYRLMPAWRERRRHLVEPDPRDAAAFVASVADLAHRAGVQPAPDVRLDVSDPAVGGFAYGAGSRLTLGISGGLVVSQIIDPPTYEAVVRHELGHVANRDVRWTYYAVGTCLSFVALALVPVMVTFAVRDPNYLLRLGWRTAVLAGLVAATMAALLRTRELYADARALEWGSGEALDHVLGRGGSESKRPEALRLHPDPATRRRLLADPDGLFTESGWVALAAAVASGTAMASIGDVVSQIASAWTALVSAVLVAPLLAGVLCIPAWRIALRETMRGVESRGAFPIGLGAGAGLAVAPLLTVSAAVGGVVSSAASWLGYLAWAAGMVAIALLVSRWTFDTARLAVTAALGSSRGPGPALTVHAFVVSLVIALWLAAGAQARLLLTNLGVGPTISIEPWDLLPSVSFGFRLPYFPLILAAALLLLPVWAYARTGGGVPILAWPWRDGGPTEPGDLPVIPEVAATRPPLRLVLVTGLGAGVIAGLAALGVLVVGEWLAADLRTSEAFGVALLVTVEWAILAAGLAGASVAALVLPRRWWPLGMLSSLIAMAVAASGAWLLLTANRYGLLAHSDLAPSPLGLRDSLVILVRPVARAVVPCALVLGVVGSLRQVRRPAGAAQPARGGGARMALAGLAAAAVAGILVAPRIVGVLNLEPPTFASESFAMQVPVGWSALVDPASGVVVMDSTSGQVRVFVQPLSEPAPPTAAGSIVVGGVGLAEVGRRQVGSEWWLFFDGRTPAGAQRIVIVSGSPGALTQHADQLDRLFAAIRWRTGKR